MRVRGERECRECGARWSYYETASVTCPECGSAFSVGVDDPTRHTDGETDLDLSAATAAAGAGRLEAAADAAAEAARDYLGTRGFIRGGELTPLDGTYVAAQELRAAGDLLAATMSVAEASEAYFLALLAGAPDGERPDASEVPEAMRSARGLGAAAAASDYRSEVATFLRDVDAPAEVHAVLERLSDHATRVEALDGDVDPADADRLVAAARDVGTFLREDDPTALDSARTRLDALA